MKWIRALPLVLLLLGAWGGAGLRVHAESAPGWTASLYTPTFITKIEGVYFIVDCWHHRVLYSEKLQADIPDWRTLTDRIQGGHSIAGNGRLYVVDDTDHSSLRVFRKTDAGFVQTQQLLNVTGRPHYVLYDAPSATFYVIASTEADLYLFQDRNGTLAQTEKIHLPALDGSYTRSFSIIDGDWFFISGSGPGRITRMDMSVRPFRVKAVYSVPEPLGGMNFIAKIGSYYYLSFYTDVSGQLRPNFIRCRDLDRLAKGEYEGLYDKLGFRGTPYYLAAFDHRYFVTEIDQNSGVKSFQVVDDEITDVRTHFFFPGHSAASEQRKASIMKASGK